MDVTEGDGEEDGGVLVVQGVGAEEVVESWEEAIARVEDMAVEDEKGDVHFFGGDCFACFVAGGEGGAFLVD